jgi:8-oxo-dGDP phosphatase
VSDLGAASAPASPAAPSAAPSSTAHSSGRGLVDGLDDQRVLSSSRMFEGAVWDIRRDVVEYGGGSMTREYVDHTGAVAVLALDDDDRVMLIKQYRHPISRRDWELPAGLRDEAGEAPLLTAQRELAEEVDLQASDWRVLSDFFTSPGGSNECLRVYLARGISSTGAVFERSHEEAQIEARWVPLDEVVDAVLARTVGNAILSIAVLAASASRARGWSSLADPDAAWPVLRRASSES